MPDATYVPNSMRFAIADLAVGDSYAKCDRLKHGEISREKVTDLTGKLRNTLNAAMRRAMLEAKNAIYTLETGNFLTNDGLIIVAVVTRME